MIFETHKIKNWEKDLKQFCGDIPVMIFANKVDLVDENTLNKAAIHKMVEDRNFFGYHLTSAKTGQGVIEAFDAIIKELYSKSKALSSA